MNGLEWSGPFLSNALSAAVLVYAASLLVQRKRFLRWSLLIVLWQFFTPRRHVLLDLALLNLYLLSAELLFMLVTEALRRWEES